jgi:hypothetical protein
VTEAESYKIRWYWDGEVRVGVLSDGTTVRSSSASGLSEKIQQVLAERGEPRNYVHYTQVAAPDGVSGRRRRR